MEWGYVSVVHSRKSRRILDGCLRNEGMAQEALDLAGCSRKDVDDDCLRFDASLANLFVYHHRTYTQRQGCCCVRWGAGISLRLQVPCISVFMRRLGGARSMGLVLPPKSISHGICAIGRIKPDACSSRITKALGRRRRHSFLKPSLCGVLGRRELWRIWRLRRMFPRIPLVGLVSPPATVYR